MQAGNQHRAGKGAVVTLPGGDGATRLRLLPFPWGCHTSRVPRHREGLPRSQPSSGIGSGENGEVAWAPCQQAFAQVSSWEKMACIPATCATSGFTCLI